MYLGYIVTIANMDGHKLKNVMQRIDILELIILSQIEAMNGNEENFLNFEGSISTVTVLSYV